MADTKTARIAELNDLCRKSMGIAGRVMQTRGFASLPFWIQSAIREKVEIFDHFAPNNDPHGEHDFGAVEYEGYRVFWKIDYYAPDMVHGSDDPADPKAVRVLTLMMAHEHQEILMPMEERYDHAIAALQAYEKARGESGLYLYVRKIHFTRSLSFALTV